MKMSLLEKNLKRVFAFILFISFAFVSFLISKHLNFVQMDLAGHIASAAQFGRSFFHSFSDQMFLGYTHGLFYPPLEEMVIHYTHVITNLNYFESYRYYLLALVAGYFFTLWALLKSFKTAWAFSFYAITLVFLTFIQKTGSPNLQGLAIDDLLKVGLSNQFLGGIWFLLICKEIIAPSKYQNIGLILYCVAAILSHLVVGFVSLLIVSGYLIQQGSFKRSVTIAGTILGLTAFYTIPFAANHSYLTSSTIVVFEPWFALLIAVTGMGLNFKNRTSRLFLGIAVLLMLPVTIFARFYFLLDLIPEFHYYRLVVVAFILTTLGLAVDLDIQKNSLKINLPLCLIFFLYLTYEFHLQSVDLMAPSFENTELNFSAIGDLQTKDYGRYLVIGKNRGIDFGIDSILATEYPEFRSTKGLYWESSYTNTLQTSYLVTLLSPPAVTKGFHYFRFSCVVQKCLLDQYFRLFNVQAMAGKFDDLPYINGAKKECYQQIEKEGTPNFTFERTGELKINHDTYPILKLVPKLDIHGKLNRSNQAVEIIDPSQIKTLTSEKEEYYREIIKSGYDACEHPEKNAFSASSILLTEQSHFEQLRNDAQNSPYTTQAIGGIPLKKISNQNYEFELPPTPTWYLLKLAPQPGMKVLNESGQELPILKGMPHTIGLGQGKLHVVFTRPYSFLAGKIMTMVTFLVSILAYLSTFLKHHPRQLFEK